MRHQLDVNLRPNSEKSWSLSIFSSFVLGLEAEKCCPKSDSKPFLDSKKCWTMKSRNHLLNVEKCDNSLSVNEFRIKAINSFGSDSKTPIVAFDGSPEEVGAVLSTHSRVRHIRHTFFILIGCGTTCLRLSFFCWQDIDFNEDILLLRDLWNRLNRKLS